ncbi:MAG: mucD 1 [Mucilaginibacter sp.]|nr:mucD 1 [Mucilaginibacter sp.]
MSDYQLLEIIERYLNGEMSQEERIKFELLRKENNQVDSAVKEHQQFAGLLKQYAERVELENRLNAIHEEIDVHTLKEDLMVHPSWIVQLWRHHHSKISVAASIVLFVIVSIMYLTGSFNNNNSKYVELKRKVDRLDRSNQSLNRSLHDIKKNAAVEKYSFTGTGFAINSNLIVTNYHVINEANSVYVQNAEGKSFKVEVLYTEPQNDIAILKIVDTAFTSLSTVPYTFKRAKSDLGEDVYTLGYSSDSPVLGVGYLTSENGVNSNDTVHYRISIPMNPGNSGGPLIDNKGNIIGVVNAKQTQIEGAHFAIKSGYLLDAIHHIPADSLARRVSLNKKNTLAGLSRMQQIKKLNDYIFMVKVY